MIFAFQFVLQTSMKNSKLGQLLGQYSNTFFLLIIEAFKVLKNPHHSYQWTTFKQNPNKTKNKYKCSAKYKGKLVQSFQGEKQVNFGSSFLFSYLKPSLYVEA